MKKVLIAICVLTLISGTMVFAAGGQEEETQTLRFAFFGNLRELEVAQQYVAEYEALHPNVTIEFESISQSDLNTKMIADHMGGGAPDVLRVAHTQVKPWASLGILLDVGPVIEERGLDFVENALDVFTYEGGVYAFPKTLACRSLLYNTDHFDAAGIPYPTSDWTWDDLLEAAEALTITEGGRTTQWGFLLAPQVPGMFGLFLEQAGGRMFTDDGSATMFNSEAGLRVLDFWNELVFESGVSPTPAVGADMNYEQGFKLGQISMIITGPWNRPVLASDFPDIHYGVAELPYDVERSNNLISDGIGIWSGTENPELCIDFAEFVTAYEQQKLWWDTLQSHFPATESGIEEILAEGLQNDPLAYPFVRGLEYSRSQVWHIDFLEYQPILVSELQAVLDENIRKDPAEALADAATAIDAILGD